MAGQPKRERLVNVLERRASAELDSGATAIDYVCAFIENGGRFNQLADSLAAELGESVSRKFVNNVANGLSTDARERLAEARKHGAAALVDEALDIAENTPPENGAVARAKMHIGALQWTAARHDRSGYGDAKPEINISLGQLHLEALRHANAARASIQAEARMLSDGVEDHTDDPE